MNAINNIAYSWDEVKSSCINGAWRKIRPDCVHKSSSKVIVEINDTSAVCEEIVNLAKEYDFEGMEESDINELLLAQCQDMTNADLMELNLEIGYEENDPVGIAEAKKLSTKRICKAMALIDEAIDIFTEDNPDGERSLRIARTLTNDIRCYKEIYMEKRKVSIQETLDKYLQPQMSTHHSTNSPNRDSEINLDSDSS